MAVSKQPPQPEPRQDADAEHGGGDADGDEGVGTLTRGGVDGGGTIRVRRKVSGARGRTVASPWLLDISLSGLPRGALGAAVLAPGALGTASLAPASASRGTYAHSEQWLFARSVAVLASVRARGGLPPSLLERERVFLARRSFGIDEHALVLGGRSRRDGHSQEQCD